MEELTCNYFDRRRCRSCSLLAHPAGSRFDCKVALIHEIFEPFIQAGTVCEPLWTPDTIFPSRSKAKLAVAGTVERPVIGLLDTDFRGIELLSCPLHLPSINSLLADLPDIITSAQLFPYSVPERRGELKGIIVKTNRRQSEMILRFILRSTEAVPRIRKFIPRLQRLHPALRVASANIQPIPHQIPEGPDEHILTSEDHIWDEFNGISLAFAPQCFSQVSDQTADALYRWAAARIAGAAPDSVLDLFCGVGGFALHSAAHSSRVLGVEVSEEAVRCARLAAERGSFDSVQFLCSDVDAFLGGSGAEAFDLVLCNPPRRGLSTECIGWMKAARPKDIIYSSCSPSSLRRDIEALSDWYAPLAIAPFDMFPLTEHVEAAAHLQLRAPV